MSYEIANRVSRVSNSFMVVRYASPVAKGRSRASPIYVNRQHRIHIQGWAKVRFPGSVIMRCRICVLLPAAGRRTQFFHLIFTKPGKHTLAHPCIWHRRPYPLGRTTTNSLVAAGTYGHCKIVQFVRAERNTGSLSHMRTMLPESSSCPQPAQRPYHAT